MAKKTLTEEVQELAQNYGKLTIGVLGSHSAEEVGIAAKANKMRTVVVCEKGRDELYAKHNKHLFDEIIVLNKFSDILKKEVQEKLIQLNTVFIPNRSFSVYVGYENIETKFKVPLYGSRTLLRMEDRNSKKGQYWYLEKAGIRFPKEFKSPKDIDRLVIVKVQQKERPPERAFFYCTSRKDFDQKSNELLKAGIISKEGLSKARIEEFVLGPRFNANFQSYALDTKFGSIDFVGFDDRIQTDLAGLLNLPAKEQMQLNINAKNEEVGHFGVTMRESLKPLVYTAAEKFIAAAKKLNPPGMTGLFSLQGALPYGKDGKPEFVVFDVSPRIPGCPCVGPTSPEMRRLSLKHGRDIQNPLDLSMMEIHYAFVHKMLGKIVT